MYAPRQLTLFKTYIYHPDKRHLVDYRALQLYMLADRMQHGKEVIEPALAEGRYVLCDRYIFTMLATMLARGRQPEPWLIDLLPNIRRPDAAFHMDVDLETCIARIRQRKSFEDAYVEREHLIRSLESYQSIARDFGMHTIHSSKHGIDEVFTIAWRIVEQLGGEPASA